MDLRFAASLVTGTGPTQFEQGQTLCNRIMEAVDAATGQPLHPTRIEDAIAAVGSCFHIMCEEAGYDPIGVAEVLAALGQSKAGEY